MEKHSKPTQHNMKMIKSQKTETPLQMKNHQHYNKHSEDNDSHDTHSTTKDSVFNDPLHDSQHHHSHFHTQKHQCFSTSSTSIISSSSTSTTSSSSSFSSSSSSSSSSSYTASSSSSSFSSDSDSESSNARVKSQHSRSCTDISKKNRYFAECDDTAPLLERDEYVDRNKKQGSTPGSIEGKPKIQQDGSVRKAKSMESLARPKQKPQDKAEQGKRTNEARKNIVNEKIQFSAFLNEITRQVLSPMRLTTLGVTNAKRSHSSGQASARSTKSENRKKKLNLPGSADSASSGKQSQSSSKYSQFHQRHYRHHSGSPDHETRDSFKRHHSWSYRHRSCSPSEKHHYHRHHHRYRSPSIEKDCHNYHNYRHHSPSYYDNELQKTSRYHTNRHCDTAHHYKDYGTSEHGHSVYKHKSYEYRDTYPSHSCYLKKCSKSPTPSRDHSEGRDYNKGKVNKYHHRDHHRPGLAHYKEEELHHEKYHHTHGHNRHQHREHWPLNDHYHGSLRKQHNKQHGPDHEQHIYHQNHHHHGDHLRELHHHGDRHTKYHQHHHGDHHREPHPHRDCHTEHHHHHHGDNHSEPRHHGDHHTEPHHHHHGDRHIKPHHHHGDHRSEPHHREDHHNEPHYHGDQHHGNHHNESHQHGDHHAESHHHEDHHSESHHHHHGDRHSQHHHQGDHNSEPHCHGDHHNEHHHHGDHRSDPHQNEPHHHHHGDNHNEPHHHHHGDNHNEPHHHGDHHSEHHSEQHKHHGDYCSELHLHGDHHHHDHNACHQKHLSEHHCGPEFPLVHLKTNQCHTGATHHGKPAENTLESLRNSTRPASASSQDEEQTSFSNPLRKENADGMGQVIILHEQNDGLQQSLLKKAVRVEYLGEEFTSSRHCLEAELQKTRLELSKLTEMFKRLNDNCSSTQQTHSLLEHKLHLVTQSMEGERERLNKRISSLTERLADAKFVNTVDTSNATQQHSHSGVDPDVPPVAAPPAQFMDSLNFPKDKVLGQEQSLGSVPEEEESDWSEIYEEMPRFVLTGLNRGQAWRHRGGDENKANELENEELFLPNSSCCSTKPHLQFTVHNKILPLTQSNLSKIVTCQSSYRVTTSPSLGSGVLVRSASLEEIPMAHHTTELQNTEAVMDLHHSGAVHDSDNELIHHLKNSRHTAHVRQVDSSVSEIDTAMFNLQPSERILTHLISETQHSEAEHSWSEPEAVSEKLLKGERTKL